MTCLYYILDTMILDTMASDDLEKQDARASTVPVMSEYFNGLVRDCSNSSALAMELLQSCTEPSV